MKKMYYIIIAILILLIITIYYHTTNLETTYHTINIGTGTKKIIIAHITDLHTKGLGKLEKNMIKKLDHIKPDVIVITGDISTPFGSAQGYFNVLKNLNSKKGIYFVQGNWEYWEPISELKQIFKETGIIDLTNKSIKLDQNLSLIGFDDSVAGNPNINLINSIDNNDIKLAIFHSPEFFDQISHKINFAFAGHTHGGQIKLPFIKTFWTPEGSGKYLYGLYQNAGSKMYVSRGIGTSVLPFRINSSPELAIFEIYY